VLTASQTVMGVALILALRFHWAAAAGLAVIFGAQFAVTDTSGRYLLSVLQVGVAVVMLVLHRRHILPTLRAPFARRPGRSPVAEDRTPVGARP
jgi:cation:H+ antiporter